MTFHLSQEAIICSVAVGIIAGGLSYAYSPPTPSSVVVLAPQGHSVFVGGLSLDYRLVGIEENTLEVPSNPIDSDDELSYHIFPIPRGSRILVSIIGPKKGDPSEDEPLRTGAPFPSR